MFVQATRTLALTASALVIMTAAVVASPARAADANAQTTRVHYQDLDLNTAGGEAALRQRVANAAKTVCGPVDGRAIADHERFDACRDNAIASASSQMNAVIASARSPDHRYAMKDDAIAMLGR
jgi:UrcA family protein